MNEDLPDYSAEIETLRQAMTNLGHSTASAAESFRSFVSVWSTSVPFNVVDYRTSSDHIEDGDVEGGYLVPDHIARQILAAIRWRRWVKSGLPTGELYAPLVLMWMLLVVMLWLLGVM